MIIQVKDLFTDINGSIRFIFQVDIANSIHTTLCTPSYHGYSVLAIYCNDNLSSITYQFLSKIYVLSI